MTIQLPFTPIREGYSVVPSYPIREAIFEGGKLRKGFDPLFIPHEITVNWKLITPIQYTAFMGFFRTTLLDSTEFFLLDLVTDIGALVPHRCRLKEGTPRLDQVKGNCFYCSTTLEVEVNPTWTGLILYEEPGLIVFNHDKPRLVGPLQPGDTIRIFNSSGIHPSGSTALNLDGIYEIDAVSGDDEIQLIDPELVNTDWTVLGTLGAPGQYGPEAFGEVTSTITRIPS